MDTHRAFARERNGGLELPSRRLNRDAGPKDGDWLCMTCGYRNWRHWGICLHCVQAFAAPPGPNVPEWNHGQIVAGGGDTRFMLLDGGGNPVKTNAVKDRGLPADGWSDQHPMPAGHVWKA